MCARGLHKREATLNRGSDIERERMKKQKTFLQRFSFFFFFSCLPLVIFSLLKQNMSPLSPPLFFSLLKTSRSKPQRPNAGRGSVQKKGSVSKKKNLACFLFVFPFFFFFFFLLELVKSKSPLPLYSCFKTSPRTSPCTCTC